MPDGDGCRRSCPYSISLPRVTFSVVGILSVTTVIAPQAYCGAIAVGRTRPTDQPPRVVWKRQLPPLNDTREALGTVR
jgi:hypothetical protein